MLKFIDVYKNYGKKNVLGGVSFEIQTGEFVFLVGPSGCGKTTAFKLIIKEEEVTSGKILIDDYDLQNLKKELIPELRRQIGVVFQDYKLISSKNVYENIAFSLELMEKSSEEIKNITNYLLDLVNLSDRANAFQDQLSGGEKQKVAIARAMAIGPQILLADEPTGNLDPISSWEVVDILKKINDKGTTVIMATHEVEIVKTMNKRVLELKDGLLVKDGIADEYVTKIQKEEKQVKLDIAEDNGGHTYIKEDAKLEVVETEPNAAGDAKTYKWSDWFNRDELEKENKKAVFVEEEKKKEVERKEFEKNFYENVESDMRENVEEEKVEVKHSIFGNLFHKKNKEEQGEVNKENKETEDKKSIEKDVEVTPEKSVLEQTPIVEKPKSRIKVTLGTKPKLTTSDSNIYKLDLPKKILDILQIEGYDSITKIKTATADELINLDGIGSKGYDKIKKAL